jgi:hypothetical protein
VRALCDDKDPEHTPYDFIITADGKQRVIIHTFLVDDGGESRMCSLYSRDMSFMDAVMHYSKLVLNDPLSNLQLLSY